MSSAELSWSAVAASLPLVAFGYPFVLALAVLIPAFRDRVIRIAWTVAVPALAVAAIRGVEAGPGASLHVRWMLLGLDVGAPDELVRPVLLATSTLWICAAAFARTYMARSERAASFWVFFLLTASGNLGVMLSRDVVTFYVAYAVMTFAAYGLILHERTADARRAGRVYVAMAVAAETAILAALWMTVRQRVDLPLSEVPRAVLRSERPELVIALLFVGFGVKAGVLPLHVWLPLAHPVAPAPASAILSGALIKAGLLGWARFLPLGYVALPSHGGACMAVGAVTIAYAAVVGALQKEPKTVLAYSSISQMGFMLMPLGIGLAVPAAATLATSAAMLFAQQHAIAKGALFLGAAVGADATGRRWRQTVLGGLSVSALAIAGGPFTSGALAKLALKDVAVLGSHPSLVATALSIGGIGSTLLMARFLASVTSSLPSDHSAASSPRRGLWGPWAVLVAVGLLLPAFASSPAARGSELFAMSAVWSASWPVLAGALVAGVVALALRRGVTLPVIPPGDLLAPVERWVAHARALLPLARANEAWTKLVRRRARLWRQMGGRTRRLAAAEPRMAELRTIGLMALAIVLVSSSVMQCSRSRHPGSALERPRDGSSLNAR